MTATVEREILLDEVGEADRRRSESGRKIDLQRSLLEVLESERWRSASAEVEDGSAGADRRRRQTAQVAVSWG